MSHRRRCAWADTAESLRLYHDHEYGRPLSSDRDYFERLVLELFQAGLSWRTILEKRDGFRRAFHDFDIRRIARYTEQDVERLRADKAIVRNRRKIEAAVENARRLLPLLAEHGSFHAFLLTLPLNDRHATVRAFRKTFTFMGPKIVEEFLMSTGHWPVEHDAHCFLRTRP